MSGEYTKTNRGTTNALVNRDNWREFVARAEQMFWATLEIEPVPSGVWTFKDPIEEAQDMMGKENVIVISLSPTPNDVVDENTQGEEL